MERWSIHVPNENHSYEERRRNGTESSKVTTNSEAEEYCIQIEKKRVKIKSTCNIRFNYPPESVPPVGWKTRVSNEILFDMNSYGLSGHS